MAISSEKLKKQTKAVSLKELQEQGQVQQPAQEQGGFFNWLYTRDPYEPGAPFPWMNIAKGLISLPVGMAQFPYELATRPGEVLSSLPDYFRGLYNAYLNIGSEEQARSWYENPEIGLSLPLMLAGGPKGFRGLKGAASKVYGAEQAVGRGLRSAGKFTKEHWKTAPYELETAITGGIKKAGQKIKGETRQVRNPISDKMYEVQMGLERDILNIDRAAMTKPGIPGEPLFGDLMAVEQAGKLPRRQPYPANVGELYGRNIPGRFQRAPYESPYKPGGSTKDFLGDQKAMIRTQPEAAPPIAPRQPTVADFYDLARNRPVAGERMIHGRPGVKATPETPKAPTKPKAKPKKEVKKPEKKVEAQPKAAEKVKEPEAKKAEEPRKIPKRKVKETKPEPKAGAKPEGKSVAPTIIEKGTILKHKKSGKTYEATGRKVDYEGVKHIEAVDSNGNTINIHPGGIEKGAFEIITDPSKVKVPSQKARLQARKDKEAKPEAKAEATGKLKKKTMKKLEVAKVDKASLTKKVKTDGFKEVKRFGEDVIVTTKDGMYSHRMASEAAADQYLSQLKVLRKRYEQSGRGGGFGSDQMTVTGSDAKAPSIRERKNIGAKSEGKTFKPVQGSRFERKATEIMEGSKKAKRPTTMKAISESVASEAKELKGVNKIPRENRLDYREAIVKEVANKNAQASKALKEMGDAYEQLRGKVKAEDKSPTAVRFRTLRKEWNDANVKIGKMEAFDIWDLYRSLLGK